MRYIAADLINKGLAAFRLAFYQFRFLMVDTRIAVNVGNDRFGYF